jgi:hypothetical protein
MTAAAHSSAGSRSRGDAILADTSGLSDVNVDKTPHSLVKVLVADDGGSGTASI